MSERIIRPRRSLIFAPGNRPEMIPKALATGADIVTVDLEDAIAPNDKVAARERTLGWFAENEAFGGVEPVVRVNCLRSVEGLADLQAIVESPRPPPAIMLPKVKSPAEVRVHEELVAQAARHRGHGSRVASAALERMDGREFGRVGASRPRYRAAQIVRVMPRSRPSFLTSVTNDLSLPSSRDRIAEKSLS